MPADPQHIQALFLRLAGLPPADRPAALDRECGADPAVRQRVAALLQAHAEPDSYLDGPSENLAATLDSQPTGADSAATGELTPNAFGAQDSLGRRTLTTDSDERVVSRDSHRPAFFSTNEATTQGVASDNHREDAITFLRQ